MFDCAVLVLTVLKTRHVRKDAPRDVTQTANIPNLVLRDGESEFSLKQLHRVRAEISNSSLQVHCISGTLSFLLHGDS